MQSRDDEKENAERIGDIIMLRISVGLLGENGHGNWWESMWFSQNASTFLSPVYGDRIAPVRYQGVVEAARRVHDDRVGVGQAYHLFRLPEGLEHALHEAIIVGNDEEFFAGVASAELAKEALSKLSSGTKEPIPGPVWAGRPQDLVGDKWIPLLAENYQAAFSSSIQTFPYFSERT